MPKRLLIVDDEPELVLLMEVRLKTSGYETLRATDGQSALEIAKKEKPDLIILDIMLPKMDGYKVCALLKKDARYAKIPIILFTARAQADDMKIGEEVGADAYITKPYDPQVLLAKIGELIEKAEGQPKEASR